MKIITGTIVSVTPYLAGQFSENAERAYQTRNASKCALIEVQTEDGSLNLDMRLMNGASPKAGDEITAELDNQGLFGNLYPEDLGVSHG